MKSLGTWAAIAVATAFAHDLASAVPHQSKVLGRAQRSTPTSLTKLASDSDSKHCTDEINAWRRELDDSAQDYQPYTAGDPSSELATFFSSSSCDALSSGNFNHIAEGMFVISATKLEAHRSEITCQDAVDIWKSGFETFEGRYPPIYKDNQDDYADPKAVGLVSLLSDESLQIFCGTADGCTSNTNTVVCYFKPNGITADQHPVSPQLWHKVEEHFGLKPTLVVHDRQHEQCLNAVNAVRGADGLGLADYTGPVQSAAKRFKRNSDVSVEEYETALYNMTCSELENSTVDPAAADGYTIIYSVKEGSVPGPVEAVDFWKTGYEQLGMSIPPVFKPKNSEMRLLKRDDQEEYSEIYYDSAVAGYVSIMADESREMRCFDATGCNKHALVCVLKDATLQEDQHPISEETWRKILKTNGITKPVLTRRNTEENCHDEINALRTREGLDLKPFVEEEAQQTTTRHSDLLNNVTCEAIEGASVAVTDNGNATSLIYHHGTDGTCAEALDAWKQAYEHFSEVDALPAYNSTSEIYTKEGATNFLSIMTPKTDVSIACYTATGCSESALVCELKPAALKEGDLPMTNSNWEKVSEFMAANSAAHISSTMALLSSAVLAAAAVALQL